MQDAGIQKGVVRGFTLIEVLLTVAITIAIAAVALPSPARFVFSQQADVVADELAGSLRKAQAYGMSGRAGSSWGVALRDGRIVLFRGTSYDARDAAYDEAYTLPLRIDVSGFDEVVFDDPSGHPSATPDVTIAWKEESWNYAVNAEGALEGR